MTPPASTDVDVAGAVAVAARVAVSTCMAVKPEETLLIVCDPDTRSIGEALAEAGRSTGAETVLMTMSPRSAHGEEPPAPIAAAMRAADVVICPTSRSLTHTAARREACSSGARVATLPAITEEVFIRGLGADYAAIAERSSKLAERLSAASQVRVTSAAGTDLSFSIAGRKGDPDTGLYHLPGQYGNLPAGEASLAPVEGTAEGRLVIDGSMAGLGLLSQPLTLDISNGMVEGISGGEQADRLRSMLDDVGELARNVAELGIGTNDRAILTGSVLEDEKILGTIHIALGNNMSYGGTVDVPIHLDGVVLEPAVTLDGEALSLV